jgi:hypothetical protein
MTAIVPPPQPGQTWAPTRAGSRAKARVVTWTTLGGVGFHTASYRTRVVPLTSFLRWAERYDARPVTP